MLNTRQEIEAPYSNVKNWIASKKYHKSDAGIYVLNEIFQIYSSKDILNI
jgi:hypothetical protein